MDSILQKLRLIESDQYLIEDAEHVVNTLAVAMGAGKSLRNTAIARGIADDDQQISKIACTLAALWNVLKQQGKDPHEELNIAQVTSLLQHMEVKPQDESTATIIHSFTPSGDVSKAKWAQAIQSYEQYVSLNDAAKIKRAQDKILPILNHIATLLQRLIAKATRRDTKNWSYQPRAYD